MRPDDLCELQSKSPPKLAIQTLDENTLLIEGTKDALRFLANLLIAVAEDPLDDGFQIAPTGSGSIFFGPPSSFGIYIHRVEKISMGDKDK